MSPLRRGAVLVHSLPLRRGRPPRRKSGWKTAKMDPLDTLWGTVVKTRDGFRCRMCPRSKATGWQMHAAHLFGRGKHSVRYDLANGFTLCALDHQWADEHKTQFHEWARKQLGPAVYDRLLVRSQIIVKTDEVLVREHLRQLLGEMDGAGC